MNKKILIVIAGCIVAAVILGICYFAITIQDVREEDDAIVNAIENTENEYEEYDYSYSGGSYATSTQDISEPEEDSQISLNENISESRQAEIPETYTERNTELENLAAMQNQYDDAARAYMMDTACSVLSVLRNYNYSSVNAPDFEMKLAGKTDALMNNFQEDNILYQEMLPEWRAGMASYKEVYSHITEVQNLSFYMKKVDDFYSPVVGVSVLEVTNDANPDPDTRYWKMIDEYQKLYAVYFLPTGDKIFQIKPVTSEVLRRDIYNYYGGMEAYEYDGADREAQ